MTATADLGAVKDQRFVISDFRLQNCAAMPEAEIAYETYRRVAASGGNAVLITHGHTSSHHASGRNPVNGNSPGWWDGLIGPCKTIDAATLFVFASNMLGSFFGSTKWGEHRPADRRAV